MTGVKEKTSLTEGPLFVKIIAYVIPIILAGILQLLYNTADQIVVGQFSGDPNALASVGSTTSATNLIINVIMGMSAGAIVVLSQGFGAKEDSVISKSVHTVVTFAAIAGVILAAVGLVVSRPILSLMGTKAELLDSATLYMRIIMCGVPASVMYNFASCVFRAKGDSKTPFIILASTGLVNVALNLVFVIAFRMGVAGVALATIISQYLSAAVVLNLLMRTKESYRLKLNKLGINPIMLKRLLIVGLPSGIQSALFSLSNMLIQSSINTLSIPEVGGATVGSSIEGYTYTAMNAYYQAALAFVGQNFGAGRLDRVKKTLLYCTVQMLAVGIAVGGIELIFIKEIASVFVDMSQPDALAIIDAAATRSMIIISLYFLCGLMEVFTGYQRGLGSSLRPMIVTLFFVCVLRVIWATFVFPHFGTAESLYVIYPISWTLCAIFQLLFSIRITRKIEKAKQIKA